MQVIHNNKRSYSSIDNNSSDSSDMNDMSDVVFSLNKIRKTLANTCPRSSTNPINSQDVDVDLNFFKNKVNSMTDKIDAMNYRVDKINSKIDKLTYLFNRLYEVATGEKLTENLGSQVNEDHTDHTDHKDHTDHTDHTDYTYVI